MSTSSSEEDDAAEGDLDLDLEAADPEREEVLETGERDRDRDLDPEAALREDFDPTLLLEADRDLDPAGLFAPGESLPEAASPGEEEREELMAAVETEDKGKTVIHGFVG